MVGVITAPSKQKSLLINDQQAFFSFSDEGGIPPAEGFFVMPVLLLNSGPCSPHDL
jgi:hypothetical protein